MNVDAVFVKGSRGKAMLKDPTDGYTYMMNRVISNKMYWRCRWYKHYKCKATAVTEGFKLTTRCNEHNHPVIAGPRRNPQSTPCLGMDMGLYKDMTEFIGGKRSVP